MIHCSVTDRSIAVGLTAHSATWGNETTRAEPHRLSAEQGRAFLDRGGRVLRSLRVIEARTSAAA
jgi:hypothetical protein